MKNIYYIIGIIVLGILSIGGYFFYENQKEKSLMEEYSAEPSSIGLESINTQNTSTTSLSTTFVSDIKSFTLSEVSVHSSKDDCWMIINNKVIDVTGFVSKHPGGNAILKGCGKDATDYFNKVPGHLKGVVQSILQRLTIGELSQ